MKVSIAQIETYEGEIALNKQKILDYITKAKENGSQLVIFPELSLPGYPCRWGITSQSIVDKNLQALQEIASNSKDIATIVGYIDRNPVEEGKRYYNASALIFEGDIQFVSYKTNITDYDYFNQSKWFEPAISLVPTKLGKSKLLIGTMEDFLFPDIIGSPYCTSESKFDEVKRKKIDAVIIVAAKPYLISSKLNLQSLLTKVSSFFKAPVVFANAVGTNGELILEGGSIAIDQNGKVISSANYFSEGLINLDLDFGAGDVHKDESTDIQRLENALSSWLKAYTTKSGASKVRVIIDGSIPSYVNAVLASRSVPREKIDTVVSCQSDKLENAKAFLSKLELKSTFISPESITKDIANLTGSSSVSANDVVDIIARLPSLVSNVLTISNATKSSVLNKTIPASSPFLVAPLKDVSFKTISELVASINKQSPIIPTSSADLDKESAKETASAKLLTGSKLSELEASEQSIAGQISNNLFSTDIRTSCPRISTDIFNPSASPPTFWAL